MVLKKHTTLMMRQRDPVGAQDVWKVEAACQGMLLDRVRRDQVRGGEPGICVQGECL